MKRLQRYYYLVGIPVLLLIVGSVLFFDEIVGTVRGNPHPQINYVIFVLFGLGAAIMLLHVRRINAEGQLVQDFMYKFKQGDTPAMLASWIKQVNGRGRYDVADLLYEVLDFHGNVDGALEHSAIEGEIARFNAQQQRRLMFAQYMGGLMVGMGLFGTFIGLLGALQEIGKLIGSFGIGPGMSDPVAAVSELVTRLTEPMKAMGVAFSASLFGVLGSIVMGMLMVFVKGAAAELVSLVHSRMFWLMELSSPIEGGVEGVVNVEPLQDALAELAEHSPLLKGLTVALDQSERRVRQLVESNTSLAARLDHTVQSQSQLVEVVQSQSQALQQQQSMAEQLQLMHRQSLDLQDRMVSQLKQWQQQQAGHQEFIQQVLNKESPWSEAFSELAQAQAQQLQQLQQHWQQGLQQLVLQVQAEREQWQVQAQGSTQQQVLHSQSVLSLMERMEREQQARHQEFMQQLLAQQSPWSEAFSQLSQAQAQQLQQLQGQWTQSLAQVVEQVQQERSQWQNQAHGSNQEQQQLAKAVLNLMERFEREQLQFIEQTQQHNQLLTDKQADWGQVQKQLSQMIEATQKQLSADSQQRLALAEQTRQTLSEMQTRQEQLVHTALSRQT